jgi:hypothetical protein
MARIPATSKQLKCSFRGYYKMYKGTSTSDFYQSAKRLLLFYSVESGLKCFLLNSMQKANTDDLEDRFTCLHNHGHDIRELAKSAKIGGQSNYQLQSFKSMALQRRIEPEELHQIWRYGIETMCPVEEAKAETVLQNIAVWLEQRI